MKYFLKIIFAIIILCNFIFASDEIKNKVDSVNAISHEYLVSNLQKCIRIFSENAERARSINYKYGEAAALARLSLSMEVSGEHEKSVESIFEAIRIFEELDSVNALSMAYGGYGYGIKRRDLNAANTYVKKGIQLAEDHNLTLNLCTLYDHYGVLKLLEDQLDSALFYYSKALDLKYQLRDSTGIPYSLNKIAELYASENKFGQALNFLQRSDSIRAHEKGEFGRAENLVHHGDLYMQMGKIDSAIFYFTRAIRKGKQLKYQHLIQYCYDQLTHLYEKKNNYIKALQNFKNYTAYKDSILNFETNSKISELQIAFETEKKDRLIAENQVELQTKNFQLHFSIAVSILILISVFFVYRYHKLKQARMRKELELRNQIEQAELEQKISDEKLRISKELHDNVGSNLTFMISSLDNMEYVTKDKGMQSKMKNLGSFGRETMEDLRDSIWAIKSEAGDVRQLIIKVNELKRKINENISKPQIVMQEDIQHADYLNSVQMLNLYRLIQEAIQNSIKHANANRVTINISENSQLLHISITDDGCGFDAESRTTGNGLSNMKSRCTAAGGNYQVSSSKQGTKITCKIFKK